nr:hypothetical protein [Candidatus Freyarchaeota archaeon]
MKTTDGKSLEVGNDKSGLNAQNHKYSNFDSEQLKLINEFSPMRESIIKSVVNRFPMKGLDTIIKQAFDEAVARNLREIKKYFLNTLYDKPQKPQTEERPHKQLKNDKASEERSNELYEPDLKRSVDNLTISKSSNRADSSPIESTKSRNSNLIVEDYQKKVEQLILEIKIRDKKLKENEEQIGTLKDRLEILEQQNMPAFLENWKLENECEGGDVEQLQNQIRRWEILWQKMRTFFKGDPKFKTLFILQRLGSISIKNLSKALNLDSNQIEPVLRELQESSFIVLDGDTLRINTD